MRRSIGPSRRGAIGLKRQADPTNGGREVWGRQASTGLVRGLVGDRGSIPRASIEKRETGHAHCATCPVSRFSFLGFWLSACGPQATAARLWKGRRGAARWGTRQPRMAEGLGERAGAKTRIACALHAQIAARSRERRLGLAAIGRPPAAAWERGVVCS